MTDDEREAAIDRTPVGDIAAALATSRALLDREGELDDELAQVLAVRTGDPIEFWVQLDEARAAWRASRGLAPAKMPFALGE